MVEYIVIWAGIAFAIMVMAGILAGVKNRDYSFWMAWGFLFPPSILLLAILPTRKGPRPRRPPADDFHLDDTRS